MENSATNYFLSLFISSVIFCQLVESRSSQRYLVNREWNPFPSYSRPYRFARNTDMEDCGGTFTVSLKEGEITSPGYNYPSIYPSNIECQWVLKAPRGSTILLNIVELNIEDTRDCSSDHLDIHSSSGHDKPPLWRLCGTLHNDIREVEANTAFLVFQSDSTIEQKGFKILYKLRNQGQDEKGVGDESEHSCFQKFTSEEGQITSPNYPRRYQPNQDCFTLINVREDQNIFLRFKEIQLKCGQDYVAVYDGATIEDTKLGQFCTLTSMVSLKSSKNIMLLHFHSEAQRPEKGFLAKYTTKGFVTGGNNLGTCTWWKGKDEGHIWSPDYPYDYPANSHCRINIVAPHGYIILIVFKVLQLESDENCTYDYIEIRGIGQEGSALLKNFCGTDESNPGFRSYGNTVQLSFNSDDSTGDKGFFLHYQFVTDRSTDACGVPRINKPLTGNLTQPSGRIIGGYTAAKGAHPWQVMFWEPSTQFTFCGGALLNDRWVASAAHCFLVKKEVEVKLGKHSQKDREPQEFITKIDKVKMHPQYNAKNYDNDIALVKIKDRFKYSDYILPLCLGDARSIESTVFRGAGQWGIATGWGKLLERGQVPEFLKEIQLPIIERKECENSDRRVTENMFCAGYSQATFGDTCEGDSGGPLSVYHRGQWYLAGIVSWGDGCAKEGRFGIYTKVINYHDWMNDILSEL